MNIEKIMEEICETCHYPYVANNEEELDERYCSSCRIEKMLKAALTEAKGVGAAEALKVVSQAMEDLKKLKDGGSGRSH